MIQGIIYANIEKCVIILKMAKKKQIQQIGFEQHKRRRKKKQLVKVLVAEISMVLAVAVIVVVALLSTMGFFVSSDGNIEQSGLIQIHSLPTGASVEIDGDTLFFRTNVSRTLPSGDHYIRLSREGYDTWEKNVTMYPGILIRLYYPRLFLQDRKTEKVAQIDAELAFYSASNDRTSALYAEVGAVEWHFLNLEGDEVRSADLDLSEILPGIEEGKFMGEVKTLEWSGDGDHALIQIQHDSEKEWILLNLKDLKNSLNLTKVFCMNFDEVLIADGAANRLFVLENHHVRRINTDDQAISRVLLNDVSSINNSGSNLIYTSVTTKDSLDKVQHVGVYRDGDKGGTTIATVPMGDRLLVAISSYYDNNYLTLAVNDEMTIYYGKLPVYNEKESADKNILENFTVLVENQKLAVTPERLNTSPGGEYVVARKEKQFMVVDAETGALHEYEAPTESLNWLDDSMVYAVLDDELKVWDFDGTNQRVVVSRKKAVADTENAQTLAKQPVMITNNNKWLYYLTRAEKGYSILREQIRD